MRAESSASGQLVFDFDGGGVTNPNKDMHMHNGLIRFDGADKLYAEWQPWQNGAAGDHKATFTLQRRSGDSKP